MTQDEINRAIAEHLGWKIAHRVVAKMPISYFLKPGQQDSDEAALDDCGECPPDYCEDLNAMHKAEKSLTDEDFEQHYGPFLGAAAHARSRRALICATAAQRAEAFVRTIGKWRDA